MTNTMLYNLNLFPHWFQTLLLAAWGLFLFVFPIYSNIKIIQSNTMLSFFRSISCFLSNRSNFLQRQIDDPIKSPKIERFLQYGMIIHFYLLSSLLLLYFTIILLLLALTEKQLSMLQYTGIWCFCLIYAYMGAVLKTHGSRELLKLRIHVSA